MTREEAIDIVQAVKFIDDFEDYSDRLEIALDMAIEALKDLPHGEWIFHKYDKDYECSNCHVRFDRTQIYTEKRFENALWAKMEIYNFCPNCGSDNRKGEGSENDTPS